MVTGEQRGGKLATGILPAVWAGKPAAAFEQDDVDCLIESPQAGYRRHAGGDTADDKELGHEYLRAPHLGNDLKYI
jgi:hypothetical protein